MHFVGPGTSLCGGSTEKLAASDSTPSNSPLAQRATDGLLRRRRDRRDAPGYYGRASRAGTVGRCARGALGRPRLMLRAQALRRNLRPRPAVGTLLAGGTASAHWGSTGTLTCASSSPQPAAGVSVYLHFSRVFHARTTGCSEVALAALPQCKRYRAGGLRGAKQWYRRANGRGTLGLL